EEVRVDPLEEAARALPEGGGGGLGVGHAVGELELRVEVFVQADGEEVQVGGGLFAAVVDQQLGGLAEGLLAVGRLRPEQVAPGLEGEGVAFSEQELATAHALGRRAVGRQALAVVVEGEVVESAA